MAFVETEELMCFAAVVDAGSMTKAAKELNCSKAHISRRINSLERRVNAKLFFRTTRSMTLTEVGSELYPKSKKLLLDSLMINRQLQSLSVEIRGRFVITAPVSISQYVLGPLLPGLQKEFPLVEFELVPTNERLELVFDGIDLAIRTGNVIDDSLVATYVGQCRDVFFATKEKFTDLEKMADLSNQHLLINPQSLQDDELIFDVEGAPTKVEYASRTLVHEYPVLLSMVANGFGVGVAPNYCVTETNHTDGVRHVLPLASGHSWPIYLLHPYQTPLPSKLLSVRNSLANTIQQQIVSLSDTL